jgi:hypothetical protein
MKIIHRHTQATQYEDYILSLYNSIMGQSLRQFIAKPFKNTGAGFLDQMLHIESSKWRLACSPRLKDYLSQINSEDSEQKIIVGHFDHSFAHNCSKSRRLFTTSV